MVSETSWPVVPGRKVVQAKLGFGLSSCEACLLLHISLVAGQGQAGRPKHWEAQTGLSPGPGLGAICHR